MKKKTKNQKAQIRSGSFEKKKEYKGLTHHPLKRIAVLFIAIGIFAFNSIVKVDVNAADTKTAITQENLLKAHNNYRKGLGLSDLSLNSLLNVSAQEKGQIMLDNNCWSHYCPPGKSPWDFFDNANYEYVVAGENLAEGFYNIEDVMNAWINSSSHRDNIVKPDFKDVGFGILYGNFLNNGNNVIVVSHFGTRLANDNNTIATKSIEISSPKNGAEFDLDNVVISGNVNGIDTVKIVSNNEEKGFAEINNGVFTYKLSDLLSGKNLIYANGIFNDAVLQSNLIDVYYKPAQAIQVSEVNGISTSAFNKNMINLIFVAILAIIFLIDFLVISRTQAIGSLRSFSHYHFGLIIIVGLIILIGGFSGQIQNGLSI